MKSTFYIILVVLILVLLYARLKLIWERINFSFSFEGLSANLFNISDLIGKGQSEVGVAVGVTIKNDNAFSFSFQDLKAKLYYQGMLIGETREGSAQLSDVTVPAKDEVGNTGKFGEAKVVDSIRIYVNSASLNFSQKLLSKQNPVIDYVVKVKVFGIPLTFKNNFVWTA